MVFSSLSFIYLFLPLTALPYFLWNNRTWRNVVLLSASLLFYSWGEPKHLILMLAATMAAYLGGLLMFHFQRTNRDRWKRFVCIVTVVLLLGNLFVFKYLNFVSDNLSPFLKISVPTITLPIGISFYTFQILSYVIDLYRGKVEVQRNYFYLLLYVSFFPQLIAGPIVRYQTIEEEILHRRETLSDVAAGLRRFIMGLAKKVLIADSVAALADVIYAGNPALYGTAMYWLAALSYTLQIYFDFSGYSDMAIGLGRMFGFHFLENFDHPYVSLSITEFWRRWHISLSTWFRDYVYIPLGGNRVSKPRWILNLFIVWGLTGFWHGAQWNFLLWGLYYAVLLLFEKLFFFKILERLPKFFRWLYSMFFVIIGWVMFNLTDFSQMFHALQMMFTPHTTEWASAVCADSSVLYGLLSIPLGLICMLPWGQWLCQRGKRVSESESSTAVSNLICLILAAVCIIFIISSHYDYFIYFRF